MSDKMRFDNKGRKVIFDTLNRNAPYNQGLIADDILNDLEKLGYIKLPPREELSNSFDEYLHKSYIYEPIRPPGDKTRLALSERTGIRDYFLGLIYGEKK